MSWQGKPASNKSTPGGIALSVVTSSWMGAICNTPSRILARSTAVARSSFSQYIRGVPTDNPPMPEKRERVLIYCSVFGALYTFLRCCARARWKCSFCSFSVSSMDINIVEHSLLFHRIWFLYWQGFSVTVAVSRKSSTNVGTSKAVV